MILALKTLREDEIRYRERGCFDLAVQRQRQADIVEAGLEADRYICSFVDRGVLGDVRYGITANGLVGFYLPSGLLWLLSADMLMNLWAACCERLEFTPENFASMAVMFAEERALRKAGVSP